MPTHCSYDYAVIRVVPDIERAEFLNAGIILFAKSHAALLCRIGLDERRLEMLAPEADAAAIRAHLRSIERVCAGGPHAGPHGHLSPSERFHWLTAPRSTVIQLSPVHSGLCEDPASEIDRLFARLVGEVPDAG